MTLSLVFEFHLSCELDLGAERLFFLQQLLIAKGCHTRSYYHVIESAEFSSFTLKLL